MIENNSHSPIDRIDSHFARHLGCCNENLRTGRIKVVESAPLQFKFAKGYPLPVFAMDFGEAIVYAVQPGMKSLLDGLQTFPRMLDDAMCDFVEQELQPEIGVVEWFRGVRLWLDDLHFIDQEFDEVRDVSETDDRAAAIRARWGGPVFGQIIDGKPASLAAVKLVGQDVWDISIETDSQWRGRGFAKSATSAAAKYIFSQNRLATWATDRDNTASLHTARSVGFRPYALEHGCFLTNA